MVAEKGGMVEEVLNCIAKECSWDSLHVCQREEEGETPFIRERGSLFVYGEIMPTSSI